MKSILVTIDSRIRLPQGLDAPILTKLRKTFTHANPEFYKQQALGLSTYNVPRTIATWSDDEGGEMSLPRGGLSRLRDICHDHDLFPRILDRRIKKTPIDWPEFELVLRDYQEDAVGKAEKHEQGIVRAPTGSGKTAMALALLGRIRQPALVIMRDNNLLEQWKERAVAQAGLAEKEIGILKGGKKLRIGRRLTLALQQTLYSASFPMDEVAGEFGAVLVDECHTVAARTFQRVIDAFPAAHRIGFSADETRRDKKEFLVYDQFGSVISEVDRADLERDGIVHPVTVRLVPTEFAADWYRDAEGGDRDFNKLLDQMTNDVARNELLVQAVRYAMSEGQSPLFIFSHRVDHSTAIADDYLFRAGIKCGLMLGGEEAATRYAEDKQRLEGGELDAAAGTFKAIGQGIDVPNVRGGVLATPIFGNRQFFGQVRGRVCRASKGKNSAFLYVMWDRHVYPKAPRNLKEWNDGLVEIFERGAWRPAA